MAFDRAGIDRVIQARIVGRYGLKRSHPRPQRGHQRRQLVGSARVVDHVVGLGETFLARGLTRDSGPGIGLVHLPEPDEAIDGDLDREIDDRNTSHRVTGVLDQQGDIQHDDRVGAELSAHSFANRCADRRVGQTIEFFEQVGVGENQRGQGETVQRTVRSDDPRTESIHDRDEDGLARLLELTGEGVSIDHNRAKPGKLGRHCRLSRSDPAGEAYNDHAPTVASDWNKRPHQSTGATIAFVERESSEGTEVADRRDNDTRTDEIAPVSWPLVERRQSGPVASVPIDRRQGSRPDGSAVAATAAATLEAAPLLPFRIAALVGSIIRSVDDLSWTNWELLTSIAVVSLYTAFAALRPVPYTNTRNARMRTLVELAIITGVVLLSGAWASPFALCLVPTAMLASFVGGWMFGTELIAGASILITLEAVRDVGAQEALPDSALWMGLLALVTVTSGLSQRTAQESANKQQAALDRVGRLAEANALLFSLQRVAQTLPASLDLDEVLDSTVTKVQALIDHSMLSIFLQSEIPGRLEPARIIGYTSAGPIAETDLPAALREALRAPKTVRREDIISPTQCLAPLSKSGLYAALRARGSVVGIIAVESLQPNHFGQQQAEILHGLAEPFGIAIDNARLFKRLRIVSADEERNRIARDLHDHIGSSLAYLGFEIDRSIAAAGRGEPVDEALRELRVQVTAMVGEVRETLYDLRSEVSDIQDLPATLKQFVDRVRGRSGLDVVFMSDQRVRLPLSHEREIWHIAREALINVERHAQATQASMEWISTPSVASLTIRDNGVGMLFGSGRVDSYGIRGMRERAAAIGAEMTAESSPTGTVVRVGIHQPKGPDTWD